MSQMSAAKGGTITPEMRMVARQERIDVGSLRKSIASGRAVIFRNTARKCVPCAVGKGLTTKVNANIGTSGDIADERQEIKKAKLAVEYGADTVMDLSIGGNIGRVRKKVLKAVDVPVGTVPVYQALVDKKIPDVDGEDMFRAIEEQVADGVDFITVHCGVTRATVNALKRNPRVAGIVSRGGAFLACWMKVHGTENPLYSDYDYLLELAARNDVVLSLGDGLRPGCLADATDRAQLAELKVLGKLVSRARRANVQVIVEGPGHVPLNQIQKNMELEKKHCKGAPFYVLGPLVTDIAPGYDHIVGAIGGAVAGMYGADFLCYVTPCEHLCLPGADEVVEGVIASKIAGHAADVAKGIGAGRDLKISRARSALNWEGQWKHALDPKKAKRLREKRAPSTGDVCTMCGDYCAIKLSRSAIK